MSYFDDYVADGLCCEQCGEFMGGSEPGYVRVCFGCEQAAKRDAKAQKQPQPKARRADK